VLSGPVWPGPEVSGGPGPCLESCSCCQVLCCFSWFVSISYVGQLPVWQQHSSSSTLVIRMYTRVTSRSPQVCSSKAQNKHRGCFVAFGDHRGGRCGSWGTEFRETLHNGFEYRSIIICNPQQGVGRLRVTDPTGTAAAAAAVGLQQEQQCSSRPTAQQQGQ
jgi:hypothetical protein